MIERKIIKIKNENSYDDLLKYISGEFIDKSVVEFLRRGLGTKCKEIAIENPYYDRDYLSSYYIYYAKKHKDFSKRCVRLLFFSKNNNAPIIGYMTLRPTYRGTHIGRVFISPYNLLSEEYYFILSKTKIHYRGAETKVNIFPQIGQECDASVCAHVSSWAILRHYSNRFPGYSEIVLGELCDIRGNIHSPRLFLTSGLTPIQIAELFTRSGFSPHVLYDTGIKGNLREDILAYIESGIPVIGVVEKNQHAVAVVGRGAEIRDKIDKLELSVLFENINNEKVDVIMSTKFVESVYVNDDHYFPYQRIDIVSEDVSKFKAYTLSDFKCAVVPLYSRINLTYSDVKQKILMLFKTQCVENGWDKPSIIRIFLASSNTYKEYFVELEKRKDYENLITVVVALELPRFIWCAELSSVESYKKGLVDHIIIMDSTAATVDEDPFLLITAKNSYSYRDQKKGLREFMVCEKLGIKGFLKNLKTKKDLEEMEE